MALAIQLVAARGGEAKSKGICGYFHKRKSNHHTKSNPTHFGFSLDFGRGSLLVSAHKQLHHAPVCHHHPPPRGRVACAAHADVGIVAACHPRGGQGLQVLGSCLRSFRVPRSPAPIFLGSASLAHGPCVDKRGLHFVRNRCAVLTSIIPAFF